MGVGWVAGCSLEYGAAAGFPNVVPHSDGLALPADGPQRAPDNRHSQADAG